MKKQSDTRSIENLLEIMAALRDPAAGCPWDREQDFATIAPYTIEEAYEVADAIERGALDELAGELGDLLFQVVFHARLAEEAGAFDFGDVVERICAKMRRRHPHVFGDAVIATAAEQTLAWEQLKEQERARAASVLDDVPVGLPALTRAVKLGRRARAVGFDWPDAHGVRAKLDEELREVDVALATEDRSRVAAEIGDVLLTLANLCRHLEIDPEKSLRAANARFETRFRRVEKRVTTEGGDWCAYDLDALETLWQQAKSED
jgi:MazG family protein